MAGKLKVEVVSSRVQARIVATLKKLDPASAEAKGVMFRIGTMLRNLAIGNITRSGAVDSGRLRASINFFIESNGQNTRVVVGAFGLKYARITELGGPFTEEMRKAMFASFRARGMKPRPSKGIIGNGYYKARPYMAPALKEAMPAIRAEISTLVTGEPT